MYEEKCFLLCFKWQGTEDERLALAGTGAQSCAFHERCSVSVSFFAQFELAGLTHCCNARCSREDCQLVCLHWNAVIDWMLVTERGAGTWASGSSGFTALPMWSRGNVRCGDEHSELQSLIHSNVANWEQPGLEFSDINAQPLLRISTTASPSSTPSLNVSGKLCCREVSGTS